MGDQDLPDLSVEPRMYQLIFGFMAEARFGLKRVLPTTGPLSIIEASRSSHFRWAARR